MKGEMADVLHDAYDEYRDGRVDWEKMAAAVHSFLGAKSLERNAVATMVAALRDARVFFVDMCDDPGDVPDRAAAGALAHRMEAALRAAGEEVE